MAMQGQIIILQKSGLLSDRRGKLRLTAALPLFHQKCRKRKCGAVRENWVLRVFIHIYYYCVVDAASRPYCIQPQFLYYEIIGTHFGLWVQFYQKCISYVCLFVPVEERGGKRVTGDLADIQAHQAGEADCAQQSEDAPAQVPPRHLCVSQTRLPLFYYQNLATHFYAIEVVFERP